MKRIFIAGHKGMVGSAICRQLESKNIDLVTTDRKMLDLTIQAEVQSFFEQNKFDEVYLAAAKVGGILANSKYPADFIYHNLSDFLDPHNAVISLICIYKYEFSRKLSCWNI